MRLFPVFSLFILSLLILSVYSLQVYIEDYSGAFIALPEMLVGNVL